MYFAIVKCLNRKIFRISHGQIDFTLLFLYKNVNLVKFLIKNGYNVFLSEQENMNGVYIPLTEQLILNSIKDKVLT